MENKLAKSKASVEKAINLLAETLYTDLFNRSDGTEWDDLEKMQYTIIGEIIGRLKIYCKTLAHDVYRDILLDHCDISTDEGLRQAVKLMYHMIRES